MLEKFYEPTLGVISIDDIDIKELDPFWLHSKIGIVAQEPELFSMSIGENILYSLEDPSSKTMDDIVAVAKIADCYDFIMNLPNKFETFCGERGSQLSSSQKQKIAIARALINDPKILLLDNVIPALTTDWGSEDLILKYLEKLTENRTTILVSNQLTYLRKCELICILDQGAVIETGTHEELMRMNGLYAKLQKKEMDGINTSSLMGNLVPKASSSNNYINENNVIDIVPHINQVDDVIIEVDGLKNIGKKNDGSLIKSNAIELPVNLIEESETKNGNGIPRIERKDQYHHDSEDRTTIFDNSRSSVMDHHDSSSFKNDNNTVSSAMTQPTLKDGDGRENNLEDDIIIDLESYIVKMHNNSIFN